MSELAETKSVKFVSLISRDDRPLYTQAFDNDHEASDAECNINAKDVNTFLKYNFLSHMALDIFASPASLSLREQQQGVEDNGGVLLLFIQDEITVHGFETNNGLKIVIGLGVNDTEDEEDGKEGTTRANTHSLDKTGLPLKRLKLKELFSQIHKCYLRTICNPFTNLHTESSETSESILQSTTFDRNIKRLVVQWNSGVNQ